ncbi:MAG: DEAD/DEAH box helicase, partial [Alphaproteobacteria bacterium]|nr:DEAD/DEAH box helicase [Alphaproteobacteria bacterium]
PVRVEVARPATTAENITQEIIEVQANDWAKRETLRRLVRDNPVKNAIVFCNRKRDVDVVAKSLQKHGFSAAALHGDLEQSQRMKTLDAFKNNEIQILVASDVAARGLDIPAVSHIFNYDVPFHADDYVHRIGRTGRAGRSGHAFMMTTPRDFKAVDAIEKLIKKTLPRRTIEGVEPRADLTEKSRDRRGRDRDRGRKGERSRPVKDHGQRAALEPLAPSTEEVAAPAPQERPRERTRSRAPERSKERPREHAREHLSERAVAAPREKHLEHATEDAVQLPAFLLRPINLPKAKDEAEKPVKAEKVAKPRSRKKKADAEATPA